jgi:hypothetical protein
MCPVKTICVSYHQGAVVGKRFPWRGQAPAGSALSDSARPGQDETRPVADSQCAVEQETDAPCERLPGHGSGYPFHPEDFSVPASGRSHPAHYRASTVASLPARHHAYSTSTLDCPQLHHPAQLPHGGLGLLVQCAYDPSLAIGKDKAQVRVGHGLDSMISGRACQIGGKGAYGLRLTLTAATRSEVRAEIRCRNPPAQGVTPSLSHYSMMTLVVLVSPSVSSFTK